MLKWLCNKCRLVVILSVVCLCMCSVCVMSEEKEGSIPGSAEKDLVLELLEPFFFISHEFSCLTIVIEIE